MRSLGGRTKESVSRSPGNSAVGSTSQVFHLLSGGHALAIGGPEALTGAELAREIGRRLGKDLQYVPVSPSDFAHAMNTAMGEPAGDRLAAIYERPAREADCMKVDPTLARDYGVDLEDAASFSARALVFS